MFGMIVRASLRNRLFVLAAAVILVAYGSFVLPRLPVDVLPDLNPADGHHHDRGRGSCPPGGRAGRDLPGRGRHERHAGRRPRALGFQPPACPSSTSSSTGRRTSIAVGSSFPKSSPSYARACRAGQSAHGARDLDHGRDPARGHHGGRHAGHGGARARRFHHPPADSQHLRGLAGHPHRREVRQYRSRRTRPRCRTSTSRPSRSRPRSRASAPTPAAASSTSMAASTSSETSA